MARKNGSADKPKGVDRMVWRMYLLEVSREKNPVRRNRLAREWRLPYVSLESI